ncbi:hypothetical protein M2227_007692 [Bradyrhizobium elkanii]|uniref:type I restriction enzyme HsdR N-terminal domain-containing protein n=1 Tax=Bradyrhizobium elkanii TaxID=29448 RepID=UPI002227EAEC|nr:type I restriction enzyme HsdR N-terminal domain-containing protein [Bradyrhizobium elkanii]MCW2205602.1 hypothetical protein [Bradyrhizobium elkanii]
MSLLNIPVTECDNESDVEQKFLFPLLTHPSFLAIPPKAISSKKYLSSLPFVAKSSLPRNYIPDYIIFISGLPVCVIEAKQPEVSADLAIQEARLYAQILNQSFPSKINPVSVVVGTNGRQLLVGPADSAEHQTFSVGELLIGSDAVAQLQKQLGFDILPGLIDRVKRSMAVSTFVKPARLMNQQLFLDKVRPNSLAPYLNQLYEMFFRGEDPEKIQLILEAAYVDTAELREYDNVLHVLLKQVENRLDQRTIQTDRRREYTLTPEISRYQSEPAQGRLHLIIGSRGSGKSLFISRFFAHLLPESLKAKAVWCIIDFNRAPEDLGNIEEFICERFIEHVENLGFDQFNIEALDRIFSVELNRFKRGPLSLITDQSERERALSNELMKLTNDKRHFAQALTRHITGDMGRPVIVAFDNVDRRKSEQQLAIFQSAQSFRSLARAFCLLTLRDVTFERFKNEPPLDTFAQLNNFYIRPPRFSLVLQKRLTLAINVGLEHVIEIEQSSNSGIRFRYNKDQLAKFLENVYAALFVGDQQVGRVVDALAERDVRDALAMFARILASGHFDADQVISIGSGSRSTITHDQLIKILMRADSKLYSENSGFLFNLFWMPEVPASGNIFLLTEILGFFSQKAISGADKIPGFWRVEEISADLGSMGFEDDEVRAGIGYLIKKKMVAFDGEETERPLDSDLVKLTPSGFIHLKSMPHFAEYISSVAMHAPMRDEAVARRIASVWSRTERFPDLDFSHKNTVAEMFSEYLVREKNRVDADNPIFRARSRESEELVKAITATVNAGSVTADRIRRSRMARAQAREAFPGGPKRNRHHRPKNNRTDDR